MINTKIMICLKFSFSNKYVKIRCVILYLQHISIWTSFISNCQYLLAKKITKHPPVVEEIQFITCMHLIGNHKTS